MPSAISGCAGSPCRRSVASSPRRISEVVTPIRGLIPQSSAGVTRGRIRDCSSTGPLLAMYAWRGIGGVRLYRVSSCGSGFAPPQLFLGDPLGQGLGALLDGVAPAGATAHVERPERAAGVDADDWSAGPGLSCDVDVVGRSEASAGQLDLDALGHEHRGGPEPAPDLQLDLGT